MRQQGLRDDSRGCGRRARRGTGRSAGSWRRGPWAAVPGTLCSLTRSGSLLPSQPPSLTAAPREADDTMVRSYTVHLGGPGVAGLPAATAAATVLPFSLFRVGPAVN